MKHGTPVESGLSLSLSFSLSVSVSLLLSRGLHPRISADLAADWSLKISDQRTAVAAAVSAYSAPALHCQLLEGVYYALVRGPHAGLASAKRDLSPRA